MFASSWHEPLLSAPNWFLIMGCQELKIYKRDENRISGKSILERIRKLLWLGMWSSELTWSFFFAELKYSKVADECTDKNSIACLLMIAGYYNVKNILGYKILNNEEGKG